MNQEKAVSSGSKYSSYPLCSWRHWGNLDTLEFLYMWDFPTGAAPVLHRQQLSQNDRLVGPPQPMGLEPSGQHHGKALLEEAMIFTQTSGEPSSRWFPPRSKLFDLFLPISPPLFTFKNKQLSRARSNHCSLQLCILWLSYCQRAGYHAAFTDFRNCDSCEALTCENQNRGSWRLRPCLPLR